MNRTKIETCDWTWNPVTGCDHGCFYCYAHRLFDRYHRDFRPTFHPERLEQPKAEQKGAVIFAVSAGDLLGDWANPQEVRQVIKVMAETPQHVYQVLTKNPRRFREFDWPTNVWLGASASGQASYNAVQFHMVDLPRPTFLSAEPMTMELELRDWVPDWLIIGPMTGLRKAPPPPAAVRALTRQAMELGVLVYHKDALRKQVGESFIIRQFPEGMVPRKWRRYAAPAKQAELVS